MAFLVSTALHGAVSMALFVDVPAASHHLRPAQKNFAPSPKSIMLELVPALKNAKEGKKPEKASVLSDIASTSQNPDSKLNLPKKDPYQKGHFERHSIERTLMPQGSPLLPSGAATPSAPHEKPKIRDLLKELEEKPKPQPPPAAEKKHLKKSKHVSRQKGEIRVQTEIKVKEDKLRPEKPDQTSPEKTAAPETPPKIKQAPAIISSPGLPVRQDDFASPGKKNILSEAEILDEIAYNSESTAVSRYLVPELKKVASVWQLKLYSLTDFSGGLFLDVRRTEIAFKIMPSGDIQNLHVIKHDGNEFTERYPLEAVEKVAPFTPLPADVISYIRTDGLWVRIDFNYTSKKGRKRGLQKS